MKSGQAPSTSMEIPGSGKVLFFIYSMAAGGAERVTANLANQWARKGVAVSLVTMAPVDDDFYELSPDIDRISLHVASDSSGVLSAVSNNLRRLKALRQVLLGVRPDVVISMMSTANVQLALVGLTLKRKDMLAIGSERVFPPKDPLSRVWSVLRRTSYRFLDCVVAVSSETEQWLKAHTSAKCVRTIFNPLILPLPVYEPRVPPSAVMGEGPFVLAVGRLVHNKGFDRLIDAFSKVAAEADDWKLAIVGTGEEHESLEARVRQLGLQGRVVFVGRVGNVGDWYKAADLFVLSSRVEGFPNVLVEAMGHGQAVISFDCDSGPRDMIVDGVNGSLVPDGDMDALVSSMRELMADNVLRAEFGRQAALFGRQLSSENIDLQWSRVFASLRHRNSRVHTVD